MHSLKIIEQERNRLISKLHSSTAAKVLLVLYDTMNYSYSPAKVRAENMVEFFLNGDSDLGELHARMTDFVDDFLTAASKMVSFRPDTYEFDDLSLLSHDQGVIHGKLIFAL